MCVAVLMDSPAECPESYPPLVLHVNSSVFCHQVHVFLFICFITTIRIIFSLKTVVSHFHVWGDSSLLMKWYLHVEMGVFIIASKILSTC